MAKLTTMPKTFSTLVYDRDGNKTTKRYYSSADAIIYFQDYLIDEIVFIQWTMQQNTMPLFGFNSYTMDHVVQGTRSIQGAFAINFTEENYIGKIIEANINQTEEDERITALNSDGEIKVDDTIDDYNKTDIDTVYPNSFDIYVNYGSNETFIRLKDVIITSISTGCSYSGEPVIETYAFIAKDLIYTN